MGTAYVVKYALTQGILKIEGEISDVAPTMFIQHGAYGDSYFHRKEWTTDPQEALQLAEEKRNKKIVSLAKQLDKVKQLKFEIPNL